MAEFFVYHGVSSLNYNCGVYLVYMAPVGSGGVSVIDPGGSMSNVLIPGVEGVLEDGTTGFDFVGAGGFSAAQGGITYNADGLGINAGFHQSVTVTYGNFGLACPDVCSPAPNPLTASVYDGGLLLTWPSVASGDPHFGPVRYTLERTSVPAGPSGVIYGGEDTMFVDYPPAGNDTHTYKVIGRETQTSIGCGHWSEALVISAGDITPPPPTTVKSWGFIAR